MSDQSQSSNQQMIIYSLIAIAVLLAAIVGFMIYQQTHSIPAPTAGVPSSSVPAPTGSSTAPGSATTPGSASVTPAQFDVKTATKLTTGMTPEQALKAYNDAVVANQFDTAYKLLPLAQRQSYGSPASMASQIKQYGITGYKLGTAQANGADTTIVSEQDTAAMNITYTWTYTKISGTWYIKSRVMGGTLQ